MTTANEPASTKRDYLSLKDAAEITTGYKQVACWSAGCMNKAWVAPWFVPYGGYCEQCKAERKEQAAEEEFQDKILSARAEREEDDE